MKNVCIVGYGAIGPIHAKALENVEQAKLYAVCDLDEKRRKLCSDKYKVVEYDNYEKVIMDEKIHSVHICTPHYLHFEMIKKALEAGKNVVAEKPVTMTRDEYAELLEMKGIEQVCVVLQNRWNPCVRKLKELVQSKILGDVKTVKGILTWHRDKTYYEKEAWRGKKATEGGCLLINQAIHTLDFFCYVIGNIVNVKTNMFNYSLENVIDGEDTLSAFFEFEKGIKGIFFATNAYGKDSNPYFEVVFENGIVRYMERKLWIDDQIVMVDEPATIGKAYWGKGHEELIKRYYDEQEFFNVKDVYNTMTTMFKMYESAGMKR